MGNATSQYERHEDDEQQRISIGKHFRLILGQVNLSNDSMKKKKLFISQRKICSSSTSNSYSSLAVVYLDIPTSPFDTNEPDPHALLQYLQNQEAYTKDLFHLFPVPLSNAEMEKTRLKSLPTRRMAAIYYENGSSSENLIINTIPVINEQELFEKLQSVDDHNHIAAVYSSKTKLYLISKKNSSKTNHQYHVARSKTMVKTIVENLDWLQPFVNFSALGYRLCGIIPLVNSFEENSLTIFWLFENVQMISYEHCLIECPLKSFDNWIHFLNLMLEHDWKLVTTLEYNQKKKMSEQVYSLMFFQRLKHN